MSLIVGILGYGEIGSSIAGICEKKYEVVKQDPAHGFVFNKPFQVMHVCIRVPDQDKFVNIVAEQISKHMPELTIIESTVPVGTTRKIAEKTKAKVVHSPCRGVHPHLEKGIKTFVKFVGGVNKEVAQKAVDYYNSLGINAVVCDTPEVTELGKLLSTTYYMANIIFCKQAARICKENGLNFEQAYKWFNETYNEGYEKLDMAHVKRPVLKSVPGKIGGHCLRSNVEILNTFAKDKYFNLFTELDDSYEDEVE